MANIPYKSTENYEPKAVLDAIAARRGAGGLMNLDRMLLHSPPFAEGSEFAAWARAAGSGARCQTARAPQYARSRC